MQVGELFVRLGLDTSQFDAGMKQAEKKSEHFREHFGKCIELYAWYGLV